MHIADADLRRVRFHRLHLRHLLPLAIGLNLVVRVLDKSLTVEADSQLLHHARIMLADLAAPDGSATGPDVVTVSGEDLPGLLLSLVGTVNLAAIRHGAGSLMPHAAAVARADGSVALLCGSSGAGKSTLATALIARGCAYLTDETTVLEPQTLEVQPFRKPISLKSGSQRLYPDVRPAWAEKENLTWCVPSSAFGSAPVPSTPLLPDILVFPSYVADIDGTDVQVCQAGEAAYLVGAQSSRLDDVAGGALPALARLSRRVPAYHLRYSDSAFASDEVLQLWPR